MFKIGDIVTLNENSSLLSRFISHLQDSNPIGVEGIVVHVSYKYLDRYKYTVNWSNGYNNTYREEDLKPIQVLYTKLAEKMIPKGYKKDKYWILL